MIKFHSWEYCPRFYLLVIFWGLFLLILCVIYLLSWHIAFGCFSDWVCAAKWVWEFLLEGNLSWSEVLGFWLLFFFFFPRGIYVKGPINLLFMETQMLKRRLKERQWKDRIDLQWWVCWLTVYRPFCLFPLCSSLLFLALHIASSVVIFSPPVCNMLRFAFLPFAKSHFAYAVHWPW